MGKLVRMIDEEGTLSVIAADSTDIVREMRSIHGTSKVCSAALGRMLTAATMMGSTLKGKDDSITVKINGGGPCGTVLAVSDSDGNVRGCIGKADISLPLNKKGKLDVAGAVGKNGFVTVIKDLGLKEPYIGKTPIVSGEIAEDITSYYAVSEQIPTVCALGVLTEHDNGEIICAGGFMIQLLPTADDTIIERVEESIKDLPPVTKMLSDGMTPEGICKKALSKFNLQLLDEMNTAYRCTCSRERVEKALIATGKSGLSEMAEDETTEVVCNFCHKKISFLKRRDSKNAQKSLKSNSQAHKKTDSPERIGLLHICRISFFYFFTAL